VLRPFLESPWLRLPLVTLVALSLQMSIVAESRLFGVTLDLMLLLAVAGGVAAGPRRGAYAGFVLGIAFDLVLQTPFGLSALVYAVAAWMVGSVDVTALRSNRWVPAVLVAAGSAGAVALYAALLAVFGRGHALDAHLAVIVAVIGVVNGVFGPMAVRIQRWTLLAGDRVRS
jgi:rod shape-determining protein MreD